MGSWHTVPMTVHVLIKLYTFAIITVNASSFSVISGADSGNFPFLRPDSKPWGLGCCECSEGREDR